MPLDPQSLACFVATAAVTGGKKADALLPPMVGGHPPSQAAARQVDRRYSKRGGCLKFFLAHCRDSWQKAFSLRVNKFIFNRADDGQENLERQRNGGGQI